MAYRHTSRADSAHGRGLDNRDGDFDSCVPMREKRGIGSGIPGCYRTERRLCFGDAGLREDLDDVINILGHLRPEVRELVFVHRHHNEPIWDADMDGVEKGFDLSCIVSRYDHLFDRNEDEVEGEEGDLGEGERLKGCRKRETA